MTFLLAIPGASVNVYATAQNADTTWSPFGPRINRIRSTVYADFDVMFSNFEAGEIDITDWPVPPTKLGSYNGNSDFFVTRPEGEFGIRQIDRNSHRPFLGVAQQQARTTVAANIANAGTVSGSCATGTGRLVVNLKNQEVSTTAALVDALNQAKILHSSGSPSSAAFDAPTGAADGQYVLPSATTCILAGTYTLSTSVYQGEVQLSVPSGGVTTLDFRVNYNSFSTLKPTAAGNQVGWALGHFVDLPNFMGQTGIVGITDYLDIFSPTAQGLDYGAGPSKLPQSILNEDCASHPWKTGCAPPSSYNLASDVIGGGARWWASAGAANGANVGYSGLDDLRAACDHFVAAGFAITGGTSNNCLEVATALNSGTAPSGSYAHLVNPGTNQVIVYPRTDPLGRRAMGTIVADSINAMFGTPNGSNTQGGPVACTVLYGSTCTPSYFTIQQIIDIIFTTTGGAVDDWNLYTGGFSLGSTADHIYGLLHTDFTGAFCAGGPTEEPSNYYMWCDPVTDTNAAGGHFAPTLPEANQFFLRAAVDVHRGTPASNAFAFVSSFAALKGFTFSGLGTEQRSSLVQELGGGFATSNSFYSYLNMRVNPGVPVSNPIYTPGGTDPTTVRRGFSQGTLRLSPFHYLTVWEADVVFELFDSMLGVNPRTGGTGLQLMDWSTTSHSSSFNPTEVSCTPDGVCVTGTTTQTWRLRNDIKFHDGTAVEAHDVVFSLITIRDVPSANLGPSLVTLTSAIALNPTTVQVKLQGQSSFYEGDVGGQPVLPQHKWGSVCSWAVGAAQPSVATLQASQCGDPAYDPMVSGTMLGHGPFVCKNLNTQAPGGSCTDEGGIGDQAVGIGGNILFDRYTGYHRGVPGIQSSSLHKYSYSDKNNDGIVNILDIADAALFFGQSNTYWDSPLFGVTSGTVDIGEIATVAFYFDHGLTKPFLPSQLTLLDPEIDPFCSPTDC